MSAAPLIKGGSFGEDLTPWSFLAGVGVELGLEESGLNWPGGVFTVYPSDRGLARLSWENREVSPDSIWWESSVFPHPHDSPCVQGSLPTVFSRVPTPGRCSRDHALTFGDGGRGRLAVLAAVFMDKPVSRRARLRVHDPPSLLHLTHRGLRCGGFVTGCAPWQKGRKGSLQKVTRHTSLSLGRWPLRWWVCGRPFFLHSSSPCHG